MKKSASLPEGSAPPGSPPEAEPSGRLHDDPIDDLNDGANEDALADGLELTAPSEANSVILERRDTRSGKAFRLGRIPIDQFDPDELAALHGGGLWTYKFCGPRGNRQQVILRRRSLTFADDLAGGRKPSPPAPAAAPGALASGDLATTLITILLNAQSSQTAFLAQQNTALLQILAKGGGGGSIDMSPIVKAIEIGSNLKNGQAASPDLLHVVTDAFKRGLELRDAVNGDDGPSPREDGLTRLAGTVTTLIGKLIDNPQGAPAPAPARALPPPPPSATALPPASAPPAIPSRASGSPVSVETIIRQYADRFLVEAGSGHDGYNFGFHVAERSRGPYREILQTIAFMARDARGAQLVTIDVRLASHPDWIEDAMEGIRDALRPEEAAGASEQGDHARSSHGIHDRTASPGRPGGEADGDASDSDDQESGAAAAD